MPSQSASPVTKPIQNLPTGSLEPNLYLNRDLSLLEFNRRVVAQAEDESLPLLERLRYLCIGSSNLDEFFEIRVSSLHARQTSDSPVSVSANSLLNKINVQCHTLVDYQYAILNRKILPRLAKNGIHIVSHNNRTEAQRAWVKSYFESQIRPLLTAYCSGPGASFPAGREQKPEFYYFPRWQGCLRTGKCHRHRQGTPCFAKSDQIAG